MDLEQLLTGLGLNIAANAVYDFLKSFARDEKEPTLKKLNEYLASHLSVNGANIKAAKIIEFLAQGGKYYHHKHVRRSCQANHDVIIPRNYLCVWK